MGRLWSLCRDKTLALFLADRHHPEELHDYLIDLDHAYLIGLDHHARTGRSASVSTMASLKPSPTPRGMI